MDLPSSGWATFWPAYMQNSMQNMHYFPNAAIYPKRKSRMMDGTLKEALGKYGIYPAEVEQSVAAGQPKECRVVIELDAEALSEKEEELCKAVLPPVEHRQLERTRRPQQRKRRQIKVSGFITSDDWLAIWEEYEAARTKPAGKRGKRASQAPKGKKKPQQAPKAHICSDGSDSESSDADSDDFED